MREIEFRGKHTKHGHWVYDDLLTKYVYHHGATIVEGGCVYNKVDPATVGQFTGIEDKHGQRIFEGDIIKVIIPKQGMGGEVTLANGAVYYEGSSFRVLQDKHPGSWVRLDSFAPYVVIEIIGNRWDNPELAEVGV